MLTFLRKIRKGLLDESQARKYILYAVGEIALVVIGILIALQINNWNEWRKDRINEEKVLIEIQKTIETNNSLSSEFIEEINALNLVTDTVITIFENQLNSKVSAENYRRAFRSGTNIYLTSAGYEELKNVGFDIIRSDKLKNEIIGLFDVEYINLKELIDFMRNNQPVYEELWIQRFNSVENGQKPIEREKLMNDPQYLALLRRIIWRRYNIADWLTGIIEKNDKVLQLIKDEL